MSDSTERSPGIPGGVLVMKNGLQVFFYSLFTDTALN